LEILADDAQGAMYICGSSAMATSVTANVKEGWTRLTAGNVGNIDSDMWLQSRKRAGRLFEDSW
jgi:sulfite reductase alpha subunit-like flavoprotein